MAWVPGVSEPRGAGGDSPEGWQEVTLDVVLASLESGARPRGGVRGITTGVPSIGAEHLSQSGGFRVDNVKFVPQSFFKTMKRGHIEVGDVLVVKDGATTGKVALVRREFPYRKAVVNEHVFICRPTRAVVPTYLFWFLFSAEGQARILENFQGSAQGGINQRFARGTPLPLPPLAEQMRIVAKAEELLSQVNAVRDRLAHVPAVLKRFRQSVLAAACSGRLTEDVRETPDSWSRVPFGTLLAKDPQNGLYKPQESYGSGVRIVRIDDYHDGRLSSWESLKRVRLTPAETERYALRPADILINRVNSPKFLGKALRLDRLPEPAVFESNMMRCTVDPSKIEPRFADLFLRSPQGLGQLRKNAKHAVNQASINQRDVVAVEFPLPPIEKQREIVRRVRDLFCLADRIGESVTSATSRVEGLTQSILGNALRGKLVPTEAELARREGREYEPASELLRRIRARPENVDRRRTAAS